MVPPLRIRDILPFSPWPNHLIELIYGCSPGNERIRREEIMAYLCHVALIEIGFVPSFVDIDPGTIPHISEFDRISTMCKEIPPHLRNSTSGVITISYRGIQEKIVESESDGETKREVRYNFTNPADVIMVMENSILSIYGIVKTDHVVPTSINLEIHSDDYLNIKPALPSPSTNKIFCESQSGQDWLNVMQLNGSELSERIKKKFGLPLLTLVDGISYEPGITDISPEILVRIFQFLDIKTILNLTETCWYLYSTAETNFLWLKLIDRDFPNHSEAVRSTLNSTTPLQVENETDQSNTPSAYTEYRRLYITALAQHPRRFISFGALPPRRRAPHFNRSMFMFRSII